jgi:lysozyme
MKTSSAMIDEINRWEGRSGWNLSSFERAVNNLQVPLTQNQFDACVSFSMNLGVGGASKILNMVKANPNNPNIRDHWLLYVKSGGKTLPGLVRRREAEITRYFS